MREISPAARELLAPPPPIHREPWNAKSYELFSKLEGVCRETPALRNAAADLSLPEIAAAAKGMTNLFQFAEFLRRRGLRVDNEPFTWREHQYLIEPYKALAINGDRDNQGRSYVWMCGAQVGKSVAGFLFLIFLALRFWGKYLGYFLPDKSMADIFSGTRFRPLALSIPDLIPLWGEDPTDTTGIGMNEDQKRVRSIGPSKLFFSYMGGKTSTESIPMLGMILDEVRRMDDGDIERAEERLSHSPYPVRFMYSTAGFPEANIDRRYRLSTQNKFHSICRCADGVILSEHFPACIGDKKGFTSPAFKDFPDYFYVCPVCKTPVMNPRLGRWIAHNPTAFPVGYHIPQTLSARQNAQQIFEAFLRAKDIQEFYNSKLGVPFIAPESQVITEEILLATVNPDLKWSGRLKNCTMGVDQMGGFNVVVIRHWGEPDETGMAKSRLVHIEWIEALNPWERCGELMHEYDVSYCVAEALPNYNDAHRFAKSFPGRVWLADYSFNPDGTKEICDWLDRPKDTVKQKRAGEDTKLKYRVKIARYQAIDWNLRLYVDRRKEQPHERGIVQEMTDLRGKRSAVFLCKDVFWTHLQKIARRKIVVNEVEGKYRMIYENIGIDPHFVHADLFAELALSRASKVSAKAFGDYATDVPEDEREQGHEWNQLDNPAHWKCARCGVSVAVTGRQSPEDVAVNAGIRCKEG